MAIGESVVRSRRYVMAGSARIESRAEQGAREDDMGREIRRGSKAHRDLERSLSERRIYESSLAWNASRPDTMMIACVDGRWRSATDEFTQSRLGPGSRADH